jgi:hypothetical protein
LWDRAGIDFDRFEARKNGGELADALSNALQALSFGGRSPVSSVLTSVFCLECSLIEFHCAAERATAATVA